jgi:hypothetical protein
MTMKILVPIDIGTRTSPELCGDCRCYHVRREEVGVLRVCHLSDDFLERSSDGDYLRCHQCLDAEVVE